MPNLDQTGPIGAGPMTGRSMGLGGLISKIASKVMPKDKPKPFNEYDIKSDLFGPEEQKKIVNLVCQDIIADTAVQKSWIEERKLDLQMKNGDRPSKIEGLTKKGWQSDRNLGITGAISDTYQSTLTSTVYNPESIHAKASEVNDIDNKDNWERFAKWMLGKNEVNALPEIDDFINVKVNQGMSMFKITWEVSFEWVDRRIPNKGKDGRPNGTYTIKTEKKRFEKAVLENIDNLDDILVPRYGCDIQKLHHFIHVLHLTGDKIQEYNKARVFVNAGDKVVESLKNISLDQKKQGLEKEQAEQLGLNDVVDEDLRALPVDIHEWYGMYEKNGKYERYRFRIEKNTKTFLSGKPLRKIRRDGKYPFSGGPFIRIPGQLKGKSLPRLIQDPSNALNSVFNQKQDFQYGTNCPFGFHRADEGYTQSKFELEPMVSYPVNGNPNEAVYFPNLQRSMAWAEQDVRLLFEIIEKQTGAASYFMSTERNVSGTATRDKLVQQKSQTRFGRWVNSIQAEICEAVTMLMVLYQDWAPKELAERVLGEDGKKLFRNLSPETLRGNYDIQMEPDIVAGSKAYEREVALWGLGLQQGTIWLDPRVNPKGNWKLVANAMKRMGIGNPEQYLPPEPPAQMGTGREVSDVWSRLLQGEVVEVDPAWNPMEMLAGLREKREKNYFDLNKEYRSNLDELIFQVELALRAFIKQAMEERMASQMAMTMGGQAPQGAQGQAPPGAGGAPPGAPPTTEVPEAVL